MKSYTSTQILKEFRLSQRNPQLAFAVTRLELFLRGKNPYYSHFKLDMENRKTVYINIYAGNKIYDFMLVTRDRYFHQDDDYISNYCKDIIPFLK